MLSTVRHLASDRLVRLQALVAGMVVALYWMPLSAGALRTFSQFWLCPVFLVVPIADLLIQRPRWPEPEHRGWRALSFGIGAWMTALLVAAVWPTTYWTPLENGVLTLLYTGYYLGVCFALIGFADAETGHSDSALERRLWMFGIIAFVAGWVSYLKIVPGIFSAGYSAEVLADAPVSLVLGVSVTAQALRLRYRAASARVRALALGLAVSSAALLVSDTLNLLTAAKVIPPVDGTWLDVFWALPALCLLVALRLRTMPYPSESAPPPASERTPLALGITLMFGAISFPVAHGILHALGITRETPRAAVIAADLVVIVTSLTVLTLGAVSHWLLERRAQSLRRERAAMLERLDEAHKFEALGRLSGSVAHDFNNLMTVVSGTAELVALDPDQTDERRDLMRLNQEAVDRAKQLTQQLLAFSRRQVSPAGVLNVSEVVEGLTPLVRRLVGESVTLNVEAAPALPSVRMNRAQLEQVLMNLVANARDAMPGGGRLDIRTTVHELTAADRTSPAVPAGSYVALVVADTGRGIDDAARPHIFEPFFTTKANDGSRGVGLATALGLVAQHGGAFGLESQLGRGSTFTVYLPAHAHDARA